MNIPERGSGVMLASGKFLFSGERPAKKFPELPESPVQSDGLRQQSFAPMSRMRESAGNSGDSGNFSGVIKPESIYF
jgi:hypothetical protein